MEDGKRVCITDLYGVRLRMELDDKAGTMMISRWCSQVEDFVETHTCNIEDTGITLERMTKMLPVSIHEPKFRKIGKN